MPSGRAAEKTAKSLDIKSMAQQTQALQDINRNEANQAGTLNQLGSEDQVNGTGAFASLDPRIADYSNRISFDSATNSSVLKLNRGNLSKTAASQAGVDSYNNLMGQAEDAARAGNFTLADQLKSQAEAATSGLKAGTRKLFTDIVDPKFAQEQALTSPEGRVMGGMIKQARDFNDPNSAGYAQAYNNLTQDQLNELDQGKQYAERQITNAQEGVGRDYKDAGAAAGAGRNIYAEQAGLANIKQQTAQQMADVENQVGAEAAAIRGKAKELLFNTGQQLEKNAPALAQMWVQNQSGFRDSFINAQVAIRNNLSQMYNQMANRQWATGYAQEQAYQKRGDVWNSVLGIVGSALSGVVKAYTGVSVAFNLDSTNNVNFSGANKGQGFQAATVQPTRSISQDWNSLTGGGAPAADQGPGSDAGVGPASTTAPDFGGGVASSGGGNSPFQDSVASFI